IGILGSGLLFGVFFGEIGKLGGLALECLLGCAQVDNGRALTLLALDQFLFVPLDLGDVGSNRDVAAIFGAPFADMHPTSVVELRLECARATGLAIMGDGSADQ